ncbi:MAG: hypothetical protein KF780_12680 [Sphingomonas sp.]|nr:hypothetical protein [Sphingomonas sp.]
MRKEVAAAAAWMRTERRRLGWSADELARRSEQMASDMGWEGPMPGGGEIEALEAERPKSLPRWFKLVRYAVEREAVPDEDGLDWLAERNTHWQRGEPLRMSRPWLFDEEDRLLRKLQKLDTDEQRAIRAFVSDYADRQRYATKEEMAAALLRRLGIDAQVVSASSRPK